MNYFYSPSENAFFPASLLDRYKEAGTLPDDLIEVDDEIFTEFSQNKEGFYRSSGKNGNPIWLEIPPLSQEELDKQKESENIGFLTSETKRTNVAIELLDDAIEFDMTTDEEVAQHKELRKYRLLLSRVPNQETWPLDPTWPTCPEFFKPKE